MAAQSTTVASMYPVGAEAGQNRAMEPSDAMGHHTSGELALLPVRDKGVSSKGNKAESIAIIPEMRWEDLTDEALIARYHAEAGQASAEEYPNELFRRHHVKVARWCLSVTGDRESASRFSAGDLR